MIQQKKQEASEDVRNIFLPDPNCGLECVSKENSDQGSQTQRFLGAEQLRKTPDGERHLITESAACCPHPKRDSSHRHNNGCHGVTAA